MAVFRPRSSDSYDRLIVPAKEKPKKYRCLRKVDIPLWKKVAVIVLGLLILLPLIYAGSAPIHHRHAICPLENTPITQCPSSPQCPPSITLSTCTAVHQFLWSACSGIPPPVTPDLLPAVKHFDNLYRHQWFAQSDLYWKQSAELRASVVNYIRSAPRNRISICQAYSMSMDPDVCKTRATTPKNNQEWHPHRLAFQQKMISQLTQESTELARRLPKFKDADFYILLTRGNSCSGKSTMLQIHPFRASSGVINPDIIRFRQKMAWYEMYGYLPDVDQIWQESDVIFDQSVERFTKACRGCSFAIDKRMISPPKIQEVLSLAANIGAKIVMMDMEAPLDVSFMRCAMRSKWGESPTVDYEYITDGYRQVHRYRPFLIQALSDPSEKSLFKLITHYELHFSNGTFSGRVAVKDAGQDWEIFNTKLYHQIIDPTLEETERTIDEASTTLNQHFLAQTLRLYIIEMLRSENLTLVEDELLQALDQVIPSLIQQSSGINLEDSLNLKIFISDLIEGIQSRVSSITFDSIRNPLYFRLPQAIPQFFELLKMQGRHLAEVLVSM